MSGSKFLQKRAVPIRFWPPTPPQARACEERLSPKSRRPTLNQFRLFVVILGLFFGTEAGASQYCECAATRHVSQLRSGYQIVRAFNVYVRPRIGKIAIYDLKRRDIVEMLDAIEDENGPVMADRVLAHVRKAFNWQAARDDQFSPPIVRGMARTKPAERARTRALSDDEIVSLWVALDSEDVPLPFRRIVRVLLLTAQRRNEVGLMRTEEIDGDVWTIPAERYKTGIPNVVPITKEARQWIGGRSAGFVFSSNGGIRAFNGYSKAKSQLDQVIARQRRKAKWKLMPGWTLHDLRRTARSLMSRAGVPSEVAEQVLGHKIPGVRGVYDRHTYAAEKRAALEKLAALVKRVVDSDNAQASA
jgi:integrase